MKFSLPIYFSLLTICLTSTSTLATFSSPQDSSLRLPLRKRSASLHRDTFEHGRDDLPTCDFKQLDRRLVQIEERYAPNKSSPEVLRHRQNFKQKWVDGIEDFVEEFFGDHEDDDKKAGKGISTVKDKTSHSFFGLPLSSPLTFDKKVKTKDDEKSSKKTNKQVKSNSVNEKLSNQVSAGQDIEFFAQVSVGTPAQTFDVNPDSGSADFWVVSNQCQSKTCSYKKDKFDSSKSSTFSAQGNKPFKLTYGIGGVSGTFFRDTISVSGIEIEKQTVAQATKLSKDYRTDQAEGVMGLGFKSITSGKEVPVLQSLFQQHSFDKQLIGFAFGRSGSNTVDKSEMSIGSVNQGLIKGNIHYTPVTKQGFWQFSFNSFYVDGDDNGGAKGIDGIVDTGTSGIAMPNQQAQDFHKGVQGSKYNSEAGYFTYPCSQEIDAVFKLKDGTTFKVNSDDMNLGREEDGSSQCVSAVMSADTGGVVVFGLTLLKNAYSVLDYQNKQIGFANYNF